MISAGEFYESQGIYDKAVMLYHKGGRVAKALEMCFDHQSFQALGAIAADLDETTDPQLVQRAATFFIDHRQYDKAVNLLIVGKRFEEALKLIGEHHVHLTVSVQLPWVDFWVQSCRFAESPMVLPFLCGTRRGAGLMGLMLSLD